MPGLSVVIITYNEERNIARCLESVQGVADDIVVVDSYSTDRTVEIAKQHGARVVSNSFLGYVEQKNFAITQARYSHILSLDADEALSDNLRHSILSVKENWEYDGYYFNRLTYYSGKWIRHGSWYPSRKLRLWDSAKGSWKGLNPHDRFRMYQDAKIKHLKGNLLHYSYYSVGEHLAQISRFTEIIARSYYRAGRTSHYFKILLSPPWRFFRDYFIKLGVLDGYYGYIIAKNSAYETFMKYVKLREIIRKEGPLPRTRLCFVNTTRSWGGGEKWHHEMAIRMHERGKDVVMVTNRKSELYNRTKHYPIRIYNLPVSNLSFLDPVKILRIAWILSREHVRTVILNLSVDVKTAGLAARLAGVKNIIYRRGLATPIRNSLYNRFLFRRILTGVIVNSEETMRNMLVNNPNLIERSKIRVIYNGIDLAKDRVGSVKPLYRKAGNEFVIGNAGRLSEQKGQVFLIELATELKQRDIPFRILIAGSGELESRLRSYASGKGVEKEIDFLGFVEDMRAFNRSLDVFVLTSLFEGFGFVLVEAMAEYRPVIAFNVSNIPEIIEDGVSGFLIPMGNIRMMADRIEQLSADPSLSRKLGENGRDRVEKQFEINRCIDQVESFLESLA